MRSGKIFIRKVTIMNNNIRLTTNNKQQTTSVIIPTLNAEEFIINLLDSLHKQTHSLNEIIIIDSESDDNTLKLVKEKNYPDVKILTIKRSEFDHGRTRDFALRQSTGDYVIFLTQDAIPENKFFIENLLAPFLTDEKIAVSSGKQIPRENASPFEKLVREFNYPEHSNIRSKKDIPEFGIKTFFTSDCCSAYKRDIYEKLGGFDFPIKISEDLFFAAKAINAGYKIAYAADAGVIHSHNFTLRQQYRRNFLIGYESEKHKNILAGVSQDKEGFRLVKYVSLKLLKKGKIFSFIRFGFDCCARLLGNKMGKRSFRKNNV